MVFCSQPTKFAKSIFNRFWGVICQPLHPESNISHFHQFSVLDSVLWLFIKTHHGLRKNIFKIHFALSLGPHKISRPYLVNLYLTDFGACSANQCIQNQIQAIFTNFPCWIVLFGFSLKLAVDLERRTSK